MNPNNNNGQKQNEESKPAPAAAGAKPAPATSAANASAADVTRDPSSNGQASQNSNAAANPPAADPPPTPAVRREQVGQAAAAQSQAEKLPAELEKLEGRFIARHPRANFNGPFHGQRFANGYTATDIETSAAELHKNGCDILDRKTGKRAFEDHAGD